MCVCAHPTGTLSCKGVRVAMLGTTNCEIAEREVACGDLETWVLHDEIGRSNEIHC